MSSHLASQKKGCIPEPIYPEASEGIQVLDDVISCWEQLHATPIQESVLNLLKKICRLGYESLPTFKIGYTTKPTQAHLIRDLFDNENVQYRNTITGKDGGTICDFLAAWNNLRDNPGADINDRLQICYSAWGVKATQNGLLDCGFQVPEFLLVHTVFLSPVGNGDELPFDSGNEPPCFHSILTPAGTVTDIHCDSEIAASLLVQLYGTKVLFSWPGTKANRDYFQKSYGTEHHLRLPEAVSKMIEGFRLTILNPGDALVLKPGMIHAVVSPDNSAIGCWEYVDAKWLDSSDSTAGIFNGARWLLDLVGSRGAQLPTDETKEQMYNPLKYGLSLWKCLLQNLQNHMHGHSRMNQKYVKRASEFVNWLEREIPASEDD